MIEKNPHFLLKKREKLHSMPRVEYFEFLTNDCIAKKKLQFTKVCYIQTL